METDKKGSKRNEEEEGEGDNDNEMKSPFSHFEKEGSRRTTKKRNVDDVSNTWTADKSKTFLLFGSNNDNNSDGDVVGKESAKTQTKHSASFFQNQRKIRRKDDVLSLQIPASLLAHMLSSSSEKEKDKKKLVLHCPRDKRQTASLQSTRKGKQDIQGIPKYSLELIRGKSSNDATKKISSDEKAKRKTSNLSSRQTEFYPVIHNDISKFITAHIYHHSSNPPSSASLSQLTQRQDSNYYEHTGIAHHHYTIKQRPAPTARSTTSTAAAAAAAINSKKIDLEKVGKKTRESLLQSKLKQKKVLRLDDDDDKKQDETKKTSIFASAIRDTAKKQKMPPKKKTKSKQVAATTTKPRKAQSTSSAAKKPVPISLKSKDISFALKALPKEEQSTLVRIYNLPLHTIQPQQIRKFLSGLSIQRIFILPSYNSTVALLDEYNEDIETIIEDGGGKQEKYTRVYVKFTSNAGAKLALERNGEMLHLPSVADNGIAIYMTPVSKTIASFLSRYMAIDGIKNDRLLDTLHKTEQRLPNGVLKTLWLMTKTTLKRDCNKQLQDSVEKTNQDDDDDGAYIPTTRQSYKALIQKHNDLWDKHEHIELDSFNSSTTTIMMAMHEWDPPSQEHDSIHRLTKSASDWLLDEMERIDARLHIASQYFLKKKELTRFSRK